MAEIEGSLRAFGGLAAMVGRIDAGLKAMGFEARLMIAPTARSALWKASGRDLPFAAEEVEFLHGVGVFDIQSLLALPRAGLARRFSKQFLDRLDQAQGRLPEARAWFAPPAGFDATLELPAEVAYAEGLLFAARRLIEQLAGLLAARHEGLRRFTLFLQHRKKDPTAVEVGLASPARDAERFAQLLREKLAALQLAAPVEAIRLQAGDFVPHPGQSGHLLRDPLSQGEGWVRLLERLQARLGGEAVHGLALNDEHRPEKAWKKEGDKKERPLNPSKPRPLWLLEKPEPVDEKTFELLAGPERIESGWWDEAEARRDYFIARRGEASLLWVYRDAGEWFLHGLFA